MPNLEDRVSQLETRVEELEVAGEHTEQVAMSAREAHRQNIRLLNAVRAAQAEHSEILTEHGQRLGAIEARLDAIDTRLFALEFRLETIEGKLSTITIGMHNIEGMLRQLIDAETD